MNEGFQRSPTFGEEFNTTKKLSFIPGKKAIREFPIANNYHRNLKVKQSLKSNKTDKNLNTMLM